MSIRSRMVPLLQKTGSHHCGMGQNIHQLPTEGYCPWKTTALLASCAVFIQCSESEGGKLNGENDATLHYPDLPGILRTLLWDCFGTAGSMCWALQSSVIFSRLTGFPWGSYVREGKWSFWTSHSLLKSERNGTGPLCNPEGLVFWFVPGMVFLTKQI